MEKRILGRLKWLIVPVFCLLLITLLVKGPGVKLKQTFASGGLALNVTSGTVGTHIFLSGSGYTPGEIVRPTWNYGGTGTVVTENSFYYFNPSGVADANGTASMSIFIPGYSTGNYTIAGIGLTSGLIETAVFHLIPNVETGLSIGPAGSVLRLGGWGFAAKEAITLYWNWNGTTGQTAGTASTDAHGAFSNRAFTVPATTANRTYTVAASGSLSKTVVTSTFTVGTPNLNTQTTPADWPTFGNNTQGTRVNASETTLSSSNVSMLALKWKSAFPIPGRVTGSPTIVNGIAYVGTVQGTLVAFNANTGSTLWTFSAKAPIYGSPTVQNGIAYFGTVNYPGQGSSGNYFYALNASNGSLIWANSLVGGSDWVDPLVLNGRVFVPTARKEAIAGGFTAFDATTGATIWSFSTPYGVWATPTADPTGSNIYVDTGNPCLDSGGGICSGYVLDVNASTGTRVWTTLIPPDISGDDDVPTTPTYNNGHLYLGCKNGLFYNLNASDGSIVWKYNSGMSGDKGIFSSAAFYNNQAFFGGGDDRMHALNASGGSVAWTYPTRGIIMSSPAIANGVLYTGSGDGSVYALNVTNGTKLWNYQTGATVMSSPVMSNGVLFVSGSDGYFYAFSLNGK